MTYQVPYTFGNATSVDASQIDANNQYILNLIAAGNTVISLLHSQISDWTSAVQQTVAQYVSSSDGSINIGIVNGLLNFTANPTPSSVEAIILSYLSNTDGSIKLTNTGGQLVISATPTVTHSSVSDWIPAVQSVISSFLQPANSSIVIEQVGSTLQLSANPGAMDHTNVTDWTPAVETTVASYLTSGNNSIAIVNTGSSLSFNYAQQPITHSTISDWTPAIQSAVLGYLSAANSSVTLASAGGQLTIQANQQPILHTVVSDWSTAVQSVIASYITNSDGSLTITNNGSNLNLKVQYPNITHSNVTDWNAAVGSAVQGYLTSDGTITFSTSGGQLVMHAVQQEQTHTIISDWTTAVEATVAGYIECTDGTLTITNTNGMLNFHVPAPTNLLHSSITDWNAAIQTSVTNLLQSTNGSVSFTTNGSNLNLSVPLQSLVHGDITDWSSSVQATVQSFLTSSNNSITFTPTGTQLNIQAPLQVIPHGNVSDWTPAVQSTIQSYLTSTNGSITFGLSGGQLNLTAVSPNIPHTNITDWGAAVNAQVLSYLKNTDGTVTLSQSGGNLLISSPQPTITHASVSDWTSAVEGTVASYLVNTDGSIHITNNGGALALSAVIPTSEPHTFISDWSTAVQTVIQSYLTSDGTVTYTLSGGQLSLHANTSTFPSSEPHTYISDWNSAVQSVVQGYLTSSDGSVHITNNGNTLNLTAPVPALTHTNISDWTTAVQNVVQSFLTSDGTVTYTLTNGQLSLHSTGSGGSLPASEPHTFISDWSTAVQNTVASYLVSTNGTISFNNSGGQLNMSASIPTTFTHTNITDWTSAVQSTVSTYLTADSTINITNTGSALNFHVPVPPLTHSNLSDWTPAVQSTIQSYLTSSNGSITFALTGGQLNMQVAGSSGNALTHSSITDWSTAVDASIQAYLTSSPSQITFTPTSGGQLSLGLATNLTHGIISDWSPAIQAGVTALLTSNPATGQSPLSITTSGANLNLAVPQQPHTWVTDWNSAVLASMQSMLISANQSITFTTVGSQLSLQVAAPTSTTGATITTNPATLTLVDGSPAGTQIAALTTTGFSGPYTYTITAINGSTTLNGQFAISGANLVAGATITNYTVATTETVTIQSTSGGNSTSATFTVNITLPSSGGGNPSTTPYFDMNFVTGTYVGTTLAGLNVVQNQTTWAQTATAGVAQIAPNTPRITNAGLFIDPAVKYIGAYDCSPNNWGYTPYSVGQTHYANVSSKTAQAASGIFNPVQFVFTENTGSRLVPGIIGASTDALPGTFVTVNLIVQPSTGNGAEGLKVQFEWLTGNGANFNYAEIAWPNLLSGWQYAINAGGTRALLQQNNWQLITCPVIREIQAGVFEIVLQHTVQGDGTPNNFTVSVAPSSGSGGTITFWGMSVAKGWHNGWSGNFGQTSTTAVTTTADVVTLTGPCAVPLSSAAGAICIELGPMFYLAGSEGVTSDQLLKVGGTDVLSLLGTGACTTNSRATTTVTGFGGLQGISRIMFTFDNTGYSVCMSGGAVQRSTTVLSMSGVQQLCTSLFGNIRRITGWIGRQTDNFIQTTTQCFNVVFPNFQNALSLNSTARTFYDDFTSNTLAPWVASPTWPGPSANGTINNYVGANASTGIGACLYNGQGSYNWIPRMCPASEFFETGGCLGVSGNTAGASMEYEWYVDPNFNWGTAGYSQINISNSNCTITATALANLPASVQAIFNAGGSNTNNVLGHFGGGPQQFASGTITSSGMFQQQFGYWEARMKVPSIGATWPAFWLMPASTAGFGSTVYEIDILEMFGQKNVSGQQYTPNSAYMNLHWNNYANNVNGVGGTAVPAPLLEWGGTTPNAMSTTCFTSWQNVALTPDFAADYNSFGLLWRNGFVEMYFNGGFAGYFDTSGQTGFTMNNQGPAYMIFNVAVGGSSGTGTPVGNENGAQMVIDWVAVYA